MCMIYEFAKRNININCFNMLTIKHYSKATLIVALMLIVQLPATIISGVKETEHNRFVSYSQCFSNSFGAGHMKVSLSTWRRTR